MTKQPNLLLELRDSSQKQKMLVQKRLKNWENKAISWYSFLFPFLLWSSDEIAFFNQDTVDEDIDGLHAKQGQSQTLQKKLDFWMFNFSNKADKDVQAEIALRERWDAELIVSQIKMCQAVMINIWIVSKYVLKLFGSDSLPVLLCLCFLSDVFISLFPREERKNIKEAYQHERYDPITQKWKRMGLFLTTDSSVACDELFDPAIEQGRTENSSRWSVNVVLLWSCFICTAAAKITSYWFYLWVLSAHLKVLLACDCFTLT